MARESEGAGNGSESRGNNISQQLSTAEAIRQVAAQNARADLSDDTQLLLFLRSWWSRIYNRPLKDPLLQEYTLEELLYEFYDRIERNAAEQERIEAAEVNKEVAKEQAAVDWAEMEEKKEIAALKAKEAAKAAKAAKEAPPKSDPTKDPDNIRWMEEQMKIAKSLHGDSFGEDLDLKFEE